MHNSSLLQAKKTRIASSAVILVLAFLFGAAWLLPTYGVDLLISCLVFAILASGLNLLLGYTGLPSFGHSAYYAVGAYTAGLMSLYVSNNFWICTFVAIIASLLVAAICGLLALRTKGIFFLIITLALAQIIWASANSWRDVTGGADGLGGIARPDLGFGVSPASTESYYVFALLLAIAALLLISAVVRSPFGEALRGVSQNPWRMSALGYNVWLYKFLSFVISGGIAGFAGVIFVFHNGFISPEAADVMVSAEIMLMVIVGGSGTLIGPVAGAFLIIILGNVASSYTDHWKTILGVLYIVTILFAPRGIWKTLANLWMDKRRI